MAEKPQRKPDWEAIELHYRAGILTVREIAEQWGDGITHAGILKRAKRDGWVRDLSGKIRAKAQALVTKAAVTEEVTKVDLVTEQAVVEANARMQAEVIRKQRNDVCRARDIVQSLFAELGVQTLNVKDLERLAELLATERSDNVEDAAKRQKQFEELRAAFLKTLDLPSRSAVAQRLADSLAKLINLERSVFAIDERKSPTNPSDDPDDSYALSDSERAARTLALLERARTRRAGQAAGGGRSE